MDKLNLTEEKVIEEAKKYNTRKGFYTNSPYHYRYAMKFGLLEKVYQHLEPLLRYDKAKVTEIAKRFNNKTDFGNYGGGASKWAYKHNIMDEICAHMEKRGNRNAKILYSYEFIKENFVYVGQTYRPKTRDSSHRSELSSSVYKFGVKVGYIPEMKLLTNDYVVPEEANRLEQSYLNEYINNGWNSLNKAKPGNQGRRSRFDYVTDKELHNITLKYNTRNEMIKSIDGSTYRYIFNKNKHHLLNHMVVKESWTEERVREIAKRYFTKMEFYNGYRKAYDWAVKHNILDDVCSHMVSDFIYHTEDSVKEVISKYTTLYDFYMDSPKEYQWLCRNKQLYKKLCGHLIKMKSIMKPSIKISIDGKVYSSYGEAKRMTGKSIGYIERRVKHKGYPKYHIV